MDHAASRIQWVWGQGSVSGDLIHLWTVASLGCPLWIASKEAFPIPGMVCGGPVLWGCVLMDSTINNASQRSMVFFSHLRCFWREPTLGGLGRLRRRAVSFSLI